MRKLYIALLCLCCLIALNSVLAQEPPPTETPTATETATASLTPSETAIASATNTLIETPTAPASETATATYTEASTIIPPIITETATILPSLTSTATATEAEQTLQLLFTETFDTLYTSRWIRQESLSFTPSESGSAIQVGQHRVRTTSQNYHDVVVQGRFKMTSGTAEMRVRAGVDGSYRFTLDTSGGVNLYRNTTLLGSASVSAVPPGQWRTLRIAALGDEISADVDGFEVFNVTDAVSLPAGAVVVQAETIGADILFDDMNLWLTSGELASYSQTPTATAEAPQQPRVGTGNRILYDMYDKFGTGTSNVWMINMDGSSRQQMTTYTYSANWYHAYGSDWSSDGSRIVFSDSYGSAYNPVTNVNNGARLFTINVDRSNYQQLLSGYPCTSNCQ